MARRSPRRSSMAGGVSGNGVLTASGSQVFKAGRRSDPHTNRGTIAQTWQYEAYRHVNICGEARYASTLFSAIAGRAELGIAEPHGLSRKAAWVTEGPEVEALKEIASSVRERSKLIRDFMLHWIIAGECYLIARDRMDTDPGYIEQSLDEDDDLITDPLDPDFDPKALPEKAAPVWEIVSVTELRKVGQGGHEKWEVRHDNGNYVGLADDDPVIRLWNPDPENRREAWSPFKAMLPTLREIEWLTKHIFTQVRSRLMSAGILFLPDNMTFPAPPLSAIGGDDPAATLASMNDAEQFMVGLAAAGMEMLEGDEVSFPSIVMTDPAALANIDQGKLIQFWSEIDDKAMTLRSDAVRRFALGMDLPPEQVLGSSGLAVTGAGGSAGSVNHWGVWANEEQTISAHIEPALDAFAGILTTAFLHSAIEGTERIVSYDTSSLRLRQDRSKEAIELYDRGVLKAKVMVREVGFDPENDMMDDAEHKMWLLNRLVSGSPSPEQMQAALALLNVNLPALPGTEVSGNGPSQEQVRQLPGRNQPPSLEDHPYEGPPREQHDHTDAPFSAKVASAEGLVLRALEKAGNRLLNDGKRGKDRDRSTPAHLAHTLSASGASFTPDEFDFSTLPVVFSGIAATELRQMESRLRIFCTDLYSDGLPYTRTGLVNAMKGL